MALLDYIASIVLLGLGGLLAFINAWVLVRQLTSKPSPSAAPLLGGAFLFAGALILPSGFLRPWPVMGLFLDYGCMPYLTLFTISIIRETRRYAEKNRILSLRYEAERCSGEIHLYPASECIYKWAAKDGLSHGSILMKVDSYVPNAALRLAIQDAGIFLGMHGNTWQLDSEHGWHNPMHSLANSTITEMAANKSMQRTAYGRRRSWSLCK